MRSGFHHSAVLLAMLVFLTGCSRSPVAPITDTSHGPGAGTTAIGEIPDDPAPVTDGGTPGTRQVTLTATDEGVVVVGRWTLFVRKRTFTMPTTITMTVTDAEAMDVHFEVSPPEANNFKQSVIVSANVSDVPDFDYWGQTMLYWNGDWKKAPSASSHANQQNVIGHFVSLSDCMVGPAGGSKVIAE